MRGIYRAGGEYLCRRPDAGGLLLLRLVLTVMLAASPLVLSRSRRRRKPARITETSFFAGDRFHRREALVQAAIDSRRYR
jgi:hypothetical protein